MRAPSPASLSAASSADCCFGISTASAGGGLGGLRAAPAPVPPRSAGLRRPRRPPPPLGLGRRASAAASAVDASSVAFDVREAVQKRPYLLHSVTRVGEIPRCPERPIASLAGTGRTRNRPVGTSQQATTPDPRRHVARSGRAPGGLRDWGGEKRSSRPAGHRRRRPHRGRKVRSGRRPRPAARRRGRQRRLHAALPGDGHRHRQADARGARRRPAPPAGHLGRHRDRQRRRVPAAGPRRDRPAARRGPHARPGRRLRACTCAGAIDALEFPGTDPEVRARLEAELDARGSGALHARLAAADPEAGRARSCPATAAASSAPWRSSRSPASPSPPTSPATTSVYDTVQIGVDVARPELDERIAAARRPDVGGRAGGRGARAWRRRGCARGARPPARSATSRCSPRSPGSAPRTRRAPRPCAPPSASPAARTRGSAATRGCTGSAAPPTDRTELPDLALALVERAVTA